MLVLQVDTLMLQFDACLATRYAHVARIRALSQLDARDATRCSSCKTMQPDPRDDQSSKILCPFAMLVLILSVHFQPFQSLLHLLLLTHSPPLHSRCNLVLSFTLGFFNIPWPGGSLGHLCC